jgi:hypothetical protein
MIHPLAVTRKAVAAFEEETGFRGLGERMVMAGIWQIKEEQGCRKTVMGPSLTSPTKLREKGTPVQGSQA